MRWRPVSRIWVKLALSTPPGGCNGLVWLVSPIVVTRSVHVARPVALVAEW